MVPGLRKTFKYIVSIFPRLVINEQGVLTISNQLYRLGSRLMALLLNVQPC